jgi:hypothetical protein
MKTQRVPIVLTIVNLALLLITLAPRLVTVEQAPSVLRGSALEIVDAQGHVRASITVVPPTVVGSESFPESVLIRLRDPDGPTVKIDASSRGTGMRLSDGSGTGAVDLASKVTGISIKVTSKDGREETLEP